LRRPNSSNPYRGINAFDEHQVVERIDKRTALMRLNNSAPLPPIDIAECFGDTILTVQVPVSKVAFFNTLLSTHPLKGEGEYLVIGGEYASRPAIFDHEVLAMNNVSLDDRRSQPFLDSPPATPRATVEFMTKSEIAARHGIHREIIGAAGCVSRWRSDG